MDLAWPEDVKTLHRHDMEQTWDRTLAPHMFNLYKNAIELYSSFAEGGGLRVLDVGCAQATLSLLLAERGHRVVALDLRQSFLDYAATRYEHGDIRFVCGDVFEVRFDEVFDLIFLNQVIEHLLNPVELMLRVRSWLAPGGRVVVTTPNGLYVKNALPKFSDLQPVEEYLHLQNSADSDGHFYAYVPDELVAVLRSAGFRDVGVQCYETPWISGHMKFRYLHRLLPFRVLKSLDTGTLSIPGLGVKLAHQLLVSGVCD